MKMLKESVSSTLQFFITSSWPRHTVTSNCPRELLVLPSATLMCTVLAFRILGCFSNLRATIKTVAPVSKRAL